MQLGEWRTQLGLGPAIGATFFSIDTGANAGQGTSGTVDPLAGAAIGMKAPAIVAGLAALGLAVAMM